MVWLVVVWHGLLISPALGGKYRGPFWPQALNSTQAAKPSHNATADFFVFDMVKL
jgi:hypothetical protein